MDEETKQRFLSKITKDKETGCWNWVGAKTSSGYGNFAIKRVNFVAHRVCYELFRGEIPRGLKLDHLCRNRSCVNPEHLEAVTQRVNLLRGETIPAKNVSKTHCPQGHEYTIENTYISKNNMRYCKECRRIRSNRYYYNVTKKKNEEVG